MRTQLSKLTLAAGIALAMAFTFSCGEGGDDEDKKSNLVGKDSSPSGSSSSSEIVLVGDNGTFKDDRDGQTYKWVKIGEQFWMAQNLNYEETPISQKRSSKCYDNKEANCEKYGRLYEWYDAVNVCPSGWHLPTKNEWDFLISHVGSTEAGKKLKSTSSDWRDGAGTDEFGFSALPGGVLVSEYGQINIRGYWWTATEGNSANPDEYATVKIMESGNKVTEEDYYYVDNNAHSSPYKTTHFSVRCLKGTIPVTPIIYGELVDERDSTKYKTVVIGTQNWMAQNLNYAGASSEKGLCYNNKAENCNKYGRLYDWATAMNIDANYNKEEFKAPPGQHKGICPEGWHLPTKTEWNALLSYVNKHAGKKLKTRSSDWGDYYGTDSYGFGALPGGALGNEFGQINIRGYWWTATEGNSANRKEYATVKIMESGNDVAEEDYYYADAGHLSPYKTSHFSVRCVED